MKCETTKQKDVTLTLFTKIKIGAVISLILILVGGYYLVPWARWERDFKHFTSSNRGLNRTVEQLNCNGDTIKTWTGTFTIEVTQSGISFTDDDGKDVKIGVLYRVSEQ